MHISISLALSLSLYIHIYIYIHLYIYIYMYIHTYVHLSLYIHIYIYIYIYICDVCVRGWKRGRGQAERLRSLAVEGEGAYLLAHQRPSGVLVRFDSRTVVIEVEIR